MTSENRDILDELIEDYNSPTPREIERLIQKAHEVSGSDLPLKFKLVEIERLSLEAVEIQETLYPDSRVDWEGIILTYIEAALVAEPPEIPDA